MEYIIAGIRIAVPQEFTAGSFGTALAPFAAADEGPADLSVETRGEIRQADGYRELDEFDFADADNFSDIKKQLKHTKTQVNHPLDINFFILSLLTFHP